MTCTRTRTRTCTRTHTRTLALNITRTRTSALAPALTLTLIEDALRPTPPAPPFGSWRVVLRLFVWRSVVSARLSFEQMLADPMTYSQRSAYFLLDICRC